VASHGKRKASLYAFCRDMSHARPSGLSRSTHQKGRELHSRDHRSIILFASCILDLRSFRPIAHSHAQGEKRGIDSDKGAREPRPVTVGENSPRKKENTHTHKKRPK
jgi:hypothetical protein